MNPLLSWSNILKTFSISGGDFFDKPTVAKNVFGLKESFAARVKLKRKIHNGYSDKIKKNTIFLTKKQTTLILIFTEVNLKYCSLEYHSHFTFTCIDGS